MGWSELVFLKLLYLIQVLKKSQYGLICQSVNKLSLIKDQKYVFRSNIISVKNF